MPVHAVRPEEILAVPAVSAGLARVERRIRRLSASSRLPLVNRAAGHITGAGGKRLRAALTLATALALGGRIDGRTVTAAACVELIHAGSLVHDDLMDGAAQRREYEPSTPSWATPGRWSSATSCSPGPGSPR